MFEKEIQRMSNKEHEEALKYKQIINSLFSFIDEISDWELIFTKEWEIHYNYLAIIVNKQLLSQQNSFMLSTNSFGEIDFFLYSLINLFFKKLLYRDLVSIRINCMDINAATCLIYNKAVHEGYTENKQKFTKKYLLNEFNLNDKRIERLCKKFNMSFNNQILEDIDIIYETKEITPAFKQRVISTNWKDFLFSLLPEKKLTNFTIKYDYDRRIKFILGNYTSGNEKKIKLNLFPHENKWNNFVNTVIHEFCHHLEHCGIFSHYEREKQKTHTPLFYAAIQILQNKSVLMGINLSDDVYNIREWEEKCNLENLEILCNELGVRYYDIRELKYHNLEH